MYPSRCRQKLAQITQAHGEIQYGGCWLEKNRGVFRYIHVMIISKYTFMEFLNEMES